MTIRSNSRAVMRSILPGRRARARITLRDDTSPPPRPTTPNPGRLELESCLHRTRPLTVAQLPSRLPLAGLATARHAAPPSAAAPPIADAARPSALGDASSNRRRRRSVKGSRSASTSRRRIPKDATAIHNDRDEQRDRRGRSRVTDATAGCRATLRRQSGSRRAALCDHAAARSRSSARCRTAVSDAACDYDGDARSPTAGSAGTTA